MSFQRIRLQYAAFSALALCLAVPSAAFAQGDTRQNATFPFDAATVETAWFDFSLGYRTIDGSAFSPEANDLFVSGQVAWAVRPRLEVGFSAVYIDRDFDDSSRGNPSGLGDTLAWGKYRFSGPGSAVFSAGGFVSLPTGDDEDFLGSGNLDGGVFVAGGASTRGNGFVQAHVGVRHNGDPEGAFAGREGETSILAGFGGSFAADSGIEPFASFVLETERFDGGDTLVALYGGARWKVNESWRVQVLGGVGLSDPAPELSLAAGMVYRR